MSSKVSPVELDGKIQIVRTIIQDLHKLSATQTQQIHIVTKHIESQTSACPMRDTQPCALKRVKHSRGHASEIHGAGMRWRGLSTPSAIQASQRQHLSMHLNDISFTEFHRLRSRMQALSRGNSHAAKVRCCHRGL